ncbi:SDR family oxidoreductase, partial [Vibrio parahaemolyticus]|nr:SDR family oxidoreductase [Vibrio parahaemolyticus]
KSEETVRNIIERRPFGRLGETKDIASVVGFLASDGGEWINGEVIVANGAFLK